MLTEGKAKCDSSIEKLFKICFAFMKFCQDDLDELEENPIDFLEQLKSLDDEGESNFYRNISSQILTRIC